jgi:hypothetical protein
MWLQQFDKGCGDGVEVISPEGANAVVVGMQIAAEKTAGDIAVRGRLDATAAEIALAQQSMSSERTDAQLRRRAEAR